MSNQSVSSSGKKRRVNLSIRQDVIEAARALRLNASEAAEAGIRRAIAEKQAAQWLNDNRQALEAHNQRIEKAGVLLTPEWALEE